MNSLCRSFPTTALAAAVVLASAAYAQQDRNQPATPPAGANRPGQANEPRQPGQPVRPGQAGQDDRAAQHAGRADAQLAACLVIDNSKEVAIGQFARERAQNEQVKAFAEKMVRDHEQFIQQLQQIANSGGYSAHELTLDSGAGARPQTPRQAQGQTPGQPGARIPGQPPAQADASQPGNAAGTPDDAAQRRAARPAELDAQARQGGDLDFIALKKEVAEKCVQSLRQELEQKPQGEFDKCYIGGQVMAHMAMVDMLEVAQQHASPELRSILQKGLQTTQMHLSEARKLAQQLEGPDADSTNRKPANP